MDTIAFGVGVKKVSWPDGYFEIHHFDIHRSYTIVLEKEFIQARNVHLRLQEPTLVKVETYRLLPHRQVIQELTLTS